MHSSHRDRQARRTRLEVSPHETENVPHAGRRRPLVGVLGAVKLKQVKTAIAQQASFQPPPEAVTTIVARQERWPAVAQPRSEAWPRSAASRSPRTSRGSSRRSRSTRARRSRRATCSRELDTRQERAQLAAAEAQRDLARANLERTRGLKDEQIVAQADYDKAEAEVQAGRGGRRRDSRHHRPQDDPARRSPACSGIRQANLGQYLAAGTPIVSLQSLDPIYVNFSRAAAAGRADSRRAPRSAWRFENAPAPRSAGKVTAIDSVVDEAPATSRSRPRSPTPAAACARACSSRRSVALGAGRHGRSTLPTSAITYAPYGDSVFVVSTLKGPNGKPLPGRGPAVRQARRRRAATRSRSLSGAPAGRGGRDLRRLQAPQRRRGPGQQQGAAVQQAGAPARGRLR